MPKILPLGKGWILHRWVVLTRCMDRYMAQLSTDRSEGGTSIEARLNIVETNSFKQIVHVSLPLVPAPDEVIKRHLATLNRQYKHESDTLRIQLSEVERQFSHRLTDTLGEKDRLKMELDRVKLNYTDQLSQLRLTLTSELSHEKAQLNSLVTDLKNKYERERMELETTWQEKVPSGS